MPAQTDWRQYFSDCVTANEYAERYTNGLLTAIHLSAIHRRNFKKAHLPRHKIKLLHAKTKAWRLAKRGGSNGAYKEACRMTRASIRQFK